MTEFQFHYQNGEKINLQPGKILCVGRNYLEHINELNNEVPTEAVLFMKPASAFTEINNEIILPTNHGEVHHEVELAILIGSPLKNASPEESLAAICGYTIALDLTLRELQAELKQKGLPWEKAKAFDGSCPIGSFIKPDGQWQQHQIELLINGVSKQAGNTEQMIRPVAQLLSEISHWFSLIEGDVVLTGTPAGVAALCAGDKLELVLDNQYRWNTQVGT